MASRFYGGLSGVEVVLPEGESFAATHEEYLAMGTTGHATEQQRAFLFGVGKDLCRRQEAEVVVLGGTDLFLAFAGYDCGFPVLDSAHVHIDALSRASLQGSSTGAA